VFCRFTGVETAGPMADNSFEPTPFRGKQVHFESQMKASSNFQNLHKVLSDVPGAAGAFLGAASQTLPMLLRGGGGSGGQPLTSELSDVATTVSRAAEASSKLPKRKQNREKKDSPEDDQSEQDFKPNVFGSLVYSRARYLLGTGSQIAESRRHTISSYIRKPTLVYLTDLVSGFFSTFLVDSSVGMCYGLISRYSRINYVSQMFRLWRGSITYTFVFFSSPFISARYNLVLSYIPSASSAPLGTLGSEIIEDITVRGTTVVSVTIPYLYGTQWSRTLGQYSYNVVSNDTRGPFLWLHEINPPYSTGDVTPVIPLYVFQSAGPDFEFRSQVCPSPTRIPSSQFESQMRVSEFAVVDPIFNESYSLPNASDDYLDVEGMCQRWNEATAAGAFPVFAGPMPTTQISAGTYTNVGVQSCFDLWANTFLFWSGQIKLKLPFIGSVTDFSNFAAKMEDNGAYSTNSIYVGSEFSNRAEDGLAAASQNITNVLECTVPYLSTYQYLGVNEFYCALAQGSSTTDWSQFNVLFDPVWDYQFSVQTGTSTTSYAPPSYWKAAGDDFSFFYDTPPPALRSTVAGGPNPWPRYDTSTGVVGNTTVFWQYMASRRPFKCSTCGKDCRSKRSSSCSESITLSSNVDSDGFSI